MDEVGEYTLEIMREAGWYNNWLYSLMKPYIKGDILEIGAGIGNFTELLIGDNDNKKLHAIDVNPGYVKKIRSEYNSGVNIRQGNIEQNKNVFGNKKFDTAICLNVLEHIKDDKRALFNVHNLLRKNGRLILLVPAHELLFSTFDAKLGHYRRYRKSSLHAKLIDAGYKRRVLRYINMPSAVGWLFFLKLTRRNTLPGKSVGIFDLLGKLLLLPEKIIEPPFGLSVFAVYEK